MKMPTIFVSHGAPDRVLSDSPSNHFMRSLAGLTSRPKGILIISAHWQTRALTLTASGKLTAVHDFYGFSDKLYQFHYNAQQTHELSQQVLGSLKEQGLSIAVAQRGLDHGSWSVLSLAYPQADIPVANLSLPSYQDYNDYVKLGQHLASLRAKGILIIGSGSATHNLRELSISSPPPSWAVDFVHWLHKTVSEMDLHSLAQFYQQAPFARQAHPTPEHLLPLLVVAGAATNENSKLIHDSYEYGSLNNSSFLFGKSS